MNGSDRTGNRNAIENGVSGRSVFGVDQSIQKWFGHMDKMADERNADRMYKQKVDGFGGRGRPKKRKAE